MRTRACGSLPVQGENALVLSQTAPAAPRRVPMGASQSQSDFTQLHELLSDHEVSLIFTYLTPKELLASAALVCRSW